MKLQTAMLIMTTLFFTNQSVKPELQLASKKQSNLQQSNSAEDVQSAHRSCNYFPYCVPPLSPTTPTIDHSERVADKKMKAS
jgi:hypothetical protein